MMSVQCKRTMNRLHMIAQQTHFVTPYNEVQVIYLDCDINEHVVCGSLTLYRYHCTASTHERDRRGTQTCGNSVKIANDTTSLRYSTKYSTLVHQFSLRLRKAPSSHCLHLTTAASRLHHCECNCFPIHTHQRQAKLPPCPVCRSGVQNTIPLHWIKPPPNLYAMRAMQ